MGLSCGAKTAKLFLFVFNALFFLFGVAVLAVGIWIAVDKSSLMKLASQALKDDADVVNNQLSAGSMVQYGAYVLIGVGVFNFIVGFCGCCGACTENKCLLGIYAFLIGLIMVIEIVGAILAGVYHKDVEKNLKNGLIRLQNNSYVGFPNGMNNAVSQALDILMISVKCCGINGVKDFTTNAKMNAYKWDTVGKIQNNSVVLKIPYACCKMKSTEWMAKGEYTKIAENLENPNCAKDMSANSYYTINCLQAVKDKIVNYASVLIGVAVAIVVIEVFGIVFTCCLMRAIEGDARRQSA